MPVMNNKLLVPTDISANSKAGIRFAIQLASQRKTSLVFYHCVRLLKPTRWTEAKYDEYRNRELKSLTETLITFVNRVYSQMGEKKTRVQFAVEEAADPARSIIQYAVKINAGAICMSTRGAGRLKKLIGTNTSAVLTSSGIPVFVIPKTYRRTAISNVLYSSDLDDLRLELKQVMRFAKQVGAKVSVYHYDYLLDLEETRQKLSKAVRPFKDSGVTFVFKKLNLEQSLAVHLARDFRKSRASIGVLFTNQRRGWFDRLFLSSKSADASFRSRIPLLIFPKG
jgi:nucleotide-binding universal stress UspA family protein